MRNRWNVLTIVVLLLFCVSSGGCSGSNQRGEKMDSDCAHEYGQWSLTKEATCLNEGAQSRTCQKCGFLETKPIPTVDHNVVVDSSVKATCTTGGLTEGKHCSVCNEIIAAQGSIAATGHVEIIDNPVSATCTTEGKTEGKHCSVCNEILVEQQLLPAFGHNEVTDEEIPATCTSEGKTAGSHCSICNTTIKEQIIIPAIGHEYDAGTIVEKATSAKEGTKKYTCTVSGCGHSYNSTYSLDVYTATELYEQSVKYVGEIVTYDSSGNEYALGTGFVISADGRIVTNYHVIEGAYSAKIKINDKTYEIESVLAYDARIDLAVLKIDKTKMKFADICKNTVNVGDTVYAVGSSRGLTNTCSQGIVTYAQRIVDGVAYVQHDASITHGNSGGPLINTFGEVVGINTWGMEESQNLNFAISTEELDNLTYITPIALKELFQQECGVFAKSKNYIVGNGEYDPEDNCYSMLLSTDYSDDKETTFYRMAYYYVEDNVITFDQIIKEKDFDFWLYFVVDPNIDGSYYWKIFSDDLEMSGTVYAENYSENSLLEYDSTTIHDVSVRQSMQELASSMMNLSCLEISEDFEKIGITAVDLGFYNYK